MNQITLENKQSITIDTGTLTVTVTKSHTGDSSYIQVEPRIDLTLEYSHSTSTRLVAEAKEGW